MAEERYGMYNRLTIEDILNDVLMNPFNGIMGRDLVTEPLDRKKDDETEKEDEERKEASEKYRTIMTMGFIKRAAVMSYFAITNQLRFTKTMAKVEAEKKEVDE